MADVDPRDQRIAELEALVAKLMARIEAQDARIAELEAQLRLNSRNSSRPPSSDPPGTARPSPPRSGRKPGGQPGHKGTKRDLVPVDKVDHLVPVEPERCDVCAGGLVGRRDAPAPLRHQVTEVPRIVPEVTEYQLCAGYCRACQSWTHAQLPRGVPTGAFGVRLISLMTLLTGRFRMSKRMTQELLSTVLGTELSLGSVANQEQRMGEALEAQVREAREHVREQNHAHLDETGWREAATRAWLWTVVTAHVTVFLISRSRGAKVVKELLGGDFTGFVITDRWSAYSCTDAALRQLCWSHLSRDFQSFIDRGGRGAALGDALLHQTRLMFRWWHRVRDGTLRRQTFQRRMDGVRREVGRLLRRAQNCAVSKTAGMAAEILKHEDALWTFVDVEGIEPTNNSAERALRPAVIWRKTSFGTHCENGSRFVERMLTVVSTLRQQGRNVLEHLVASYDAHLRGAQAPSLLPASGG